MTPPATYLEQLTKDCSMSEYPGLRGCSQKLAYEVTFVAVHISLFLVWVVHRGLPREFLPRAAHKSLLHIWVAHRGLPRAPGLLTKAGPWGDLLSSSHKLVPCLSNPQRLTQGVPTYNSSQKLAPCLSSPQRCTQGFGVAHKSWPMRWLLEQLTEACSLSE